MKYLRKMLCFFFVHRWIYPCGNNDNWNEIRFCWHCEKIQIRGLTQKYPHSAQTGAPHCLVPCWCTMPRWWTNEVLYGNQKGENK